MYEDYGDYFTLELSDHEIILLLLIIEHYSSIHYDRLNSCDSKILAELYARIYKKLGGKNGR